MTSKTCFLVLHALRRRAVWLVVNDEGKVETNAEILQPSPPRDRDLSMSTPKYIVFTDSELELARRSYFEQKRLGNEHAPLSKELFCRLIRNTMTNMISIARASEDCRYPSKHEVGTMAERLVENYPMIKNRSSKDDWEHVAKQLQKRLKRQKSKVPPSKKPRRDQQMDADQQLMDELQRIIQPKNSRHILEVKDTWEAFYSKVRFDGVRKKAMKPPKTLNGGKHVFTALPLLFPSNTVPPRKLGASREALFRILTVRLTATDVFVVVV
ncbi:hypothetical protein KUCAC02_019424 [Chaenocephalus aceratus]|uniref:Uncharacterized protein n=1 Tax=Chaenocephalus aceratus TaxID=36190 RepID=A0ACB9VNC2_CHAAC|nr:hypothetical protein KUCAC02_019424 [Chaenocephalus aceratus]